MRAAADKNQQFFHRYRLINSYYEGGRKNPFGVVNFPEEMGKLDNIARRDACIQRRPGSTWVHGRCRHRPAQ